MLYILVGPTAVGKTELSLALASEMGAEIISADSMQVYRGMDIGTAKPSGEERRRVPHHLIDVADPREEFSVGEYARLAEAAIADIAARGKKALVVGGTGLYVRALVYGLFDGPPADWSLRERFLEKERDAPGSLFAELVRVDPASAAKIKPADMRRIIRALEVYEKAGRPISSFHEQAEPVRQARIVGLRRERAELYALIERRVDEMMRRGFLDEVRGLRDLGCSRDTAAMQALGYKQLMAHLDGEYPLDEAVRLIKRNTKRYAKRQFTWFNAERMEWLDAGGMEADIILKKTLDIFGDLG